MRRKPSQQGSGGYNNQQRKQRYQPGGGEHRHSHGGQNRPRKNYAAAREKYLAQARDAMSSGDRVLAENYYQHAEHCYRMMVEEGYQVRNNYTPQANQNADAGNHDAAPHAATDEQSQDNADSGSQLPAFLTAAYDQPQQGNPVDPSTIQNWEERDA